MSLISYTFKCPKCGSTKLKSTVVHYQTSILEPELMIDEDPDGFYTRVLFRNVTEGPVTPVKTEYGCGDCDYIGTLADLRKDNALTEVTHP